MRIFTCETCGSPVEFEAAECPSCRSSLGYLTEQLDLRVLRPGDAPATFVVAARPSAAGEVEPGAMWRCLNAAWGCNWMLPAGTGDVWCRACRLTRGRPDETNPDAVEAWAAAETAKRRLVHQLDALGLPIDARSWDTPRGLAFDLVHLPGTPGITGHLEGVVTLDLTEVDEQHREDLRRRLAEPFRTLIGHFRHEIGHFYWELLVGHDTDLERFRELFGDERADYSAALERHHASDTRTWDTDRFVTAYATAHPFEDWAETFAHYLHVLDASDTAAWHGLSGPVPDDPDMSRILERWAPLAAAVNAVACSLGAPAVYPFHLTGRVVDKLAFVHERVRAHTSDRRVGAAGA